MATLAQLITQIENTIYPNTAKEIDAASHQALLISIVNAVYPVPSEATGIPAWTSTENIVTGTYWLYNDGIWLALDDSGPDSGGPVEPGTDAAYWLEIDSSALAHPQNTDYKLGVYPINVQANDGIIDLTNNASFDGKNLIRVNPSAPEVEKEVTIITDSTNASREFYVVYAASTGSIKLVNDSNQVIGVGDSPLILEQYDFAKFTGNFGPVSGGWTQLITSNKLQGAGGGGHTLEEPDGTPLDQRDNLRASAPLRFTNPIGELYSELDFNPDEILEEDFDDITANTVALTGTGDVLTATTFDTGEALTEDELVGDILIVTHDSLTDFNPIPKEAFRVVSNTTAGVITIEGTFVYTTAGAGFDVLEPYEIPANKDFLLACKPSGNDLAVQFPLVANETNRNKIEIYWEDSFTPTNNRVFMFTKTGQKIKESEKAELIAENESMYFRHHAAGTFHFDLLQVSWVNSVLDVNILTPYATAVTTASALVPIPATAWDTDSPLRWTCELVDDPTHAGQLNVESTYTSLLERQAQILGFIEIQRPSGSNRTVELVIQKWNGAAWVNVDNSLRSIILTTSGSRNDLNVSARVILETNDKYRLAFSSNDTVTILKAGINMIKTQ